ncbi:GNAT family N-acetyltransferase [Anaerosporobacter faecicola]|uniref:GNAT family N-acetyltransferase n=1 Tax=Anaerosporobacter faecicola TaxID=2718714 RepID=UPI00143B1E33|nr:GNAT family protein [Anaerosporobacter faecicola]
MKLYYETNRLQLRVLTSSYAEEVLAFYEENKDYFNRWEPDRVRLFYTKDFHRANLVYEYNETVKLHFLRFWLFEKTNPEKIIGSICFQNFQKGSLMTCTVGYKLDHRYTGRGYATEALEKALSVVFNELGFHRIEALIHPMNEPSIELAERLHFEFEGIAKSCIRLNKKWTDHLRYALINPLEL